LPVRRRIWLGTRLNKPSGIARPEGGVIERGGYFYIRGWKKWGKVISLGNLLIFRN